MLKAIIFDMDGVLINTEPFHYELWKDTFANHGLQIDYDHYKGCIGSTAAYLMDIIYEEYGVDFRGNTAIVEEQKALKAQRVKEHGIPRIEGVPQMLRKVAAEGYQMAVASSSPQYYIQLAIKQLGVSDCFNVLVSGEGVENPKPAPDVFLKAASVLEVLPEECLVVEDSCNGCKAAIAAKMACAGYYNPDSGNQDLSMAHGIIDDYEKVNSETLENIYKTYCMGERTCNV